MSSHIVSDVLSLQMREKYGEVCAASGARIISFCGFGRFLEIIYSIMKRLSRFSLT